MKNMLDHII